MREFQYKAFISYSHTDRDWAAWLLASLENYRIPRHLVGRKTDLGMVPPRLTPIFRDRDELPAAQRLTDRLFEALRASEFLIVLCSPAAVKSKMVNREIEEFKKYRGEGYILCMIVGGTPFSEDPDTECFPPAVLKAIRPDGSTKGFSPEGLAADVRQEGDGKRMGLIKIVAGMIGVGLNDIVRREEQRRQRHLAGALATAGIAVSVMGGLLYEATEARKAAVQAQDDAEARQTDLEQELAFSNELTEFMMQDVYARMLEVGDMATLELITKKIIDTFENKAITFRDHTQFFRYTAVLLRYGQMLERRGDSELAKYFFDRTLKISTKYHAENPNSSRAWFRLQNNHYFVAYLALRQGRLATARHHFERQLALLDQAEKLQDVFRQFDKRPNNKRSRWLVGQRSESRSVYGQLLAGPMGRPGDGVATLRAAVEGYQSKLSTDRNPGFITEDLSEAYWALGYALLYDGRITEAEAAFENSRITIGALLEEGSNNMSGLRRNMLAYQGLAKTALCQGRPGDATDLLSRATQGFDVLVAWDADNTMWLANSARAYIELAAAATELGDTTLAVKALETSQTQITKALERDATRVDRHLTRYQGLLLRAELALKAGNTASSHVLLHTLSNEFASKNRTLMRTNGYVFAAAKTQFLRYQLFKALQDPRSAALALQSAISLIETSEATRTMEIKNLQAQLYDLTNRKDEAAALQAELKEYGYSHAAVASALKGSATALTEM